MPTIIICFVWVSVMTLMIGLWQSGSAATMDTTPAQGLEIIGGTQYQDWLPYAGRPITTTNVTTEPNPNGNPKAINFQLPTDLTHIVQMTIVRNNSHGTWFEPAETANPPHNDMIHFEYHLGTMWPWEVYRASIDYTQIEQLHNNTPTATTVSTVITLQNENFTVFISVSSATNFHNLLWHSNTYTVTLRQVYTPDIVAQQGYSWTNLLVQIFTLQFPASADATVNIIINVMIAGPFYIALAFIALTQIDRIIHGGG